MNGILRALFWGTVYYDIKVVLLFESGDKILKGDHTNESYWSVLSCGAVYSVVQGRISLTFESVDEILSVTIQIISSLEDASNLYFGTVLAVAKLGNIVAETFVFIFPGWPNWETYVVDAKCMSV